MVWFQCECGESLKKPSVARHLQQRRCCSVTCVDCSTTFYGADYEKHIKCVSEAQKYMGKLYKEDGASREGAKQDNWINAVSDVLSSYTGPLRHYVDRLQQYDNIPRKQKAFENFVTNSLNLKREPSTATQLWKIIEPCVKKPAENSTNSSQQTNEWKSYKEETLDILDRHGGSLPWKLIQAHLAKRRKTTHPHEDFEHIRTDVLANIPTEFLSASSNLVVASR
jgi:cell growth-regulating nucleolar protein